MRRISAVFFSLVLFLIFSGFQSFGNLAFAHHDTDTDLLVKFKISVNEEWVKDFFAKPRQISLNTALDTYQVFFYSREERNYWLGRAKIDPLVEYADYNHRYYLETTPNDPQYSNQWALSRVDMPNAWDFTTGSSSIIVAVIDTGVDGQHEDLSGKTTVGYDYINNVAIGAGVVSDDHGHGTFVAGVIAALTNNSKGIAGMDWNAQLMPLKVVNSAGVGNSAALTNGITFAADNGAKIINLSLGGQGDDPTLADAIRYAAGKGVLVIAASGNENAGVSYPAAYNEVLAVGAVDENDNKASFSNYGPELDVMAPGVNILTTKLSAAHNQYQTGSGTSLAAPFVSGLAALMWARNPGISSSEVKSAIENNTDKISQMGGENFTSQYGYGRINARKVLASFGNFHSQFANQNGYATLLPGQSYNFQVSFTNNGKSTWYQSGPNPVRLGTSRDHDRIPSFVREDIVNNNPSGWVASNRIKMQQSQVSPGGVATFSFWMSVPENITPGIYREYFQLVADGMTWMEDYGVYWEVKVPTLAERYHSQWVNQNGYPTLNRGQPYSFTVQFKNTGLTAWDSNIVRLGTSHTQNRIPGFIREDIVNNNSSSWIAQDRIKMLNNTVVPGEMATFNFWYTVPADKALGIYREYFQLVADGITWMEDYGVYWDIVVQ